MIILDHPDCPMLDEKFKPCREERCANLQLHAEHHVPVKRGRQLRRCPVCNAPITRIPRKRAFCSKCSWRIVNNPNEEIESARDQP